MQIANLRLSTRGRIKKTKHFPDIIDEWPLETVSPGFWQRPPGALAHVDALQPDLSDRQAKMHPWEGGLERWPTNIADEHPGLELVMENKTFCFNITLT